jgi:hypothetical protein
MQVIYVYDEKKCMGYDKGTSSHNTCKCDIIFRVSAPKIPDIIERRVLRVKDGVKRNFQQMVEEFFFYVVRGWTMVGQQVSRITTDPDMTYAISHIAASVGLNQIPIPPPVDSTYPRSTYFVLNHSILPKMKEWDVRYFRTYFGVKKEKEYYEKEVWHEISENTTYVPGIKWSSVSNNLLSASLRKRSFYNMSLTGYHINGKNYKSSVYAQENLYPIKITKLIDKYSKKTHVMPPLLSENKYILPLAIRSMAKFAGWDVMYHNKIWDYEQAIKDLIKITPMSSCGVRPGPSDCEEIEPNMFIHKTCNGKKLEQALPAARIIDKIVEDIRAGRPPLWTQPHAKVVIKSEVHHSFTFTEEELIKISEKAREYFIPDLVTILLSQLVHGYRQKLERGKLIRIGMDWNYGGMQEFAEYFRYRDPDFRYVTFDITGFDTSVIKVMLQAYSMWSKVYMKFKSPEVEKLYNILLTHATCRLTTKIAQLIGNIWRIIDGVMPSGAYETSHGDSWITALVYFAYFEYLSLTDLEFRKYYTSTDIMIMLSVYGDDNVLGFHKKYAKWFTKEKIEEFFKQFANFTIRDFELHESFLSVPDGKGGLKHKGVVFLQKYCIETPIKYRVVGMPAVVHYRPVEVCIRKFVKGSGDQRLDLDYFLSALSGVYDNPFNQVWHDFCFMMYQSYLPNNNWIADIDLVIGQANGYVTRMMRKTGVKVDVLKRGFPLAQDIIDISRVNKEHHRNVYRDIWSDSLIG